MDLGILKKASFQVWTPFNDDVRVKIAFASREELFNIRAAATEKVLVGKDEFEEKYDPLKADVLLGQAVVKDWEGFTDDGAPFPCTPENVELLMRKWGEFSRFVNNVCVDLEYLQEAAKRATEKN